MPKYTLRWVIRAFWAKVEKLAGDDACWEWRGAVIISKNLEYGQFRSSFFACEALAHRVSWMLAKRKLIPKRKQVCHCCDNSLCVRPSHLFLGTQKDNEDDKISKGRSAIGANSPRALHPDSYVHLQGDTHWARQHPELVARGSNSAAGRNPEAYRRRIRLRCAKLSAKDVLAIRSNFTPKIWGEAKRLAIQYNVCAGTIRAIVYGYRWKNL